MNLKYLEIAIKDNKVKAIELYLKMGVDPNSPNLIELACKLNRPEIVMSLIDYGLDESLVDKALIIAAIHGNLNICKILTNYPRF